MVKDAVEWYERRGRPQKAWVMVHVTPVKPGWYVAQQWVVHEPKDAELTKEQRNGYAADEVVALWMVPRRSGRGGYISDAKKALWLPPDAHVDLISWSDDAPDNEAFVQTYAIFVEFNADDAQSLVDLGLDPDATTAESFYQATGEWPASTATARIEVVQVPVEYRNIVADVRSMQDDGWTIARENDLLRQDIYDRLALVGEKKTGAAGGRWQMGEILEAIDMQYGSKMWRQDEEPPAKHASHGQRERW